MWKLHLQVYTCLVGLGWSSANYMNYFKELEEHLPLDYLFSKPDISGCCENCCEFRETFRIFSQNAKGSKCEKLFKASEMIISMIDKNGKPDCTQCNYSSTVLLRVEEFKSNFSKFFNSDYPCECQSKNNIGSSEMPSSTVYPGTENPTSLVTAATKLPTVSEKGGSSEMPSSTVYTGTENPTSLVTAATKLPTVSEKGDKYLSVIIVLVLVLLGAICILCYFYNKIKQLNKELKNLKQLVDLDLCMR